MSEFEFHSFRELMEERQKNEQINYFKQNPIQKAYFIGAYARAVIYGSLYSEVSKGNTTYKKWLSNQIISYRNLDKIFEAAFRFEQKLKLRIRNDSEVRRLVHEVPGESAAGFSNAKISYAFVAGFDDYSKFCDKYPLKDKNDKIEKEFEGV